MSCEQFLSSSWCLEKAAVSYLLQLSRIFSGQGAIILHCLQRTLDQTITLSGSQLVQTVPMGSDSTDKWALGHPAIERREKRDQWLHGRKDTTVLFNFLSSVPLWDTAAQLFYQQSCGTVNERGTPGGSQTFSFLSPVLSVWHCDYGHFLDSLWWSL